MPLQEISETLFALSRRERIVSVYTPKSEPLRTTLVSVYYSCIINNAFKLIISVHLASTDFNETEIIVRMIDSLWFYVFMVNEALELPLPVKSIYFTPTDKCDLTTCEVVTKF